MHESPPFETPSARPRAAGPTTLETMGGESDQQDGGSTEVRGRRDRPAVLIRACERRIGTRRGCDGRRRGQSFEALSDAPSRRDVDARQNLSVGAGTFATVLRHPPGLRRPIRSAKAGRHQIAARREGRLDRRMTVPVLADDQHGCHEREEGQLKHRRGGADLSRQSATRWAERVHHPRSNTPPHGGQTPETPIGPARGRIRVGCRDSTSRSSSRRGRRRSSG